MILPPFAAADPFNTPLTPGAEADRDSDAMMGQLAPYFSGAALANDLNWGIPRYRASADDPWLTIQGSQYFNVPFTVHFPLAAEANTGSDGHLLIVGPSGQYLTEAWRFVWNANQPTAASAWQFDATRGCSGRKVSGVYGGVTSSLISLHAGLVLAAEIAAGQINHALAITVPTTAAALVIAGIEVPVFRFPARDSDGTTQGGIPMGSRLRLDPDVSLSGLSYTLRPIAQALQTFGAIVMDTGGALAVMAESPATGTYPLGTTSSLAGIPWDSVSVLA